MSGIKSFPSLKNDLILRAARGERTERVPVWIMRQAGRYLPEFREIRKQHSFFEICRTPALACEVTLQPIKRFSLDAAIIFSDILVIPQALGLEVQMKPEVGPYLPDPLSVPEDIKKLNFPCDVQKELNYVFDAISLTRHKLEGMVPLIGFSGAPWTLMCYMVEGGGSKTMSKAKTWLYRWPTESNKLLQLLTDVIVDYLVQQIIAGAQLLQLFESTAEYLPPSMFELFCLPYLKEIKSRVTSIISDQCLEMVPMILFAKGSSTVLDLIANAGYEVISLDWTVLPMCARNKVPKNISLQGNLDPVALKADKVQIEKLVKDMLMAFGTQKYIANLGHGIYPDIDPDNVAVFVDSVHKISQEINCDLIHS